MKLALVLFLLAFAACTETQQKEEAMQSTAQDETAVRQTVTTLHASMMRAFNGAGVNTDSLLDSYYDNDIYYVTPWGWSEPLDSTKSRLRRALGRIKDYDNRVENLEVKVYGNGAYASYILRQNSTVDGQLLEEYLPTTLILERRGQSWKIVRAHRSTDYETFQQYIALQKRQEDTK